MLHQSNKITSKMKDIQEKPWNYTNFILKKQRKILNDKVKTLSLYWVGPQTHCTKGSADASQ